MALCLALLLPAPLAAAQTRPRGAGAGSPGAAGLRPATEPLLSDTGPSGLCEAAIRRAEQQYRLPAGLLFAISLAESGRTDPVTRRVRPWPWSVQAGDTSYYFDTKAEAVRWVQDARARGVASIDTGCLQVNLYFHPQAFETVDHAFDPPRNADYAARFLLELYASTNDWGQATGFYHSRTPALAGPYQQRVQQAMTGKLPPGGAPPPPPTVASRLSVAWQATLDPAAAPNGAQRQNGAPRTGNGWETLLGRQSAPQHPPPARLAARLAANADTPLRPPSPFPANVAPVLAQRRLASATTFPR